MGLNRVSKTGGTATTRGSLKGLTISAPLIQGRVGQANPKGGAAACFLRIIPSWPIGDLPTWARDLAAERALEDFLAQRSDGSRRMGWPSFWPVGRLSRDKRPNARKLFGPAGLKVIRPNLPLLWSYALSGRIDHAIGRPYSRGIETK